MLRSVSSLCALLLTACLFLPGLLSANPENRIQRGMVLYEKHCAECHATDGQGVENEYDDPLYGNRSLQWLAGRIERTMPEGDEDAVVGEDAQLVAEYVYDAFYSAEARSRLELPPVELSRLTAPQHKTSIADLVGYFRGGSFNKDLSPGQGLAAQYYPTRSYRGEKDYKGEDIVKRTDDRVRFDFGSKSPFPEKMKAEEFSVRWEGSVIAEETGTYEFIVRSRNGFRLWVNEREQSDRDGGNHLIDGWVASGNEIREEKASIFLLGGRAYPLRLDFFSYKEEQASIELLWKPPHGVPHVIPKRNLHPERLHETLVINTPFPPDDRSYGYERGTAVSRSWYDAVTGAGLETAAYVADHLNQLAYTNDDAGDREAKVRKFLSDFTTMAFRRPLTDEQKKKYIDAHFQDAESIEAAAKKSVLLTVTAPQFLYPDLGNDDTRDGYDVAARLALSLWDSIPDRQLRQFADQGKLTQQNHLENQTRRMLGDPRTRAKLHGFFDHWLELERANNMSKDTKRFPGFSEAVMADLRTSLRLFIDGVVWSENSDFRQLLLADYVLLNRRLGELYDVDVETWGFKRVNLQSRHRAGVVTHPYLLSSFAYHDNTSPIHRGVFLTRNIVGMTLKPPPEAVEFEDSDFDPDLTMREKVTELTRSQACMACHSTINPLGFSLENFDAIGRWRTKEKNQVIDAAGDFVDAEGETVEFANARDIARYAANSPSAHKAFIEMLFEHAVKQPVHAYGSDNMENLHTAFREQQFNIRELLLDMAVKAASHEVPALNPEQVAQTGN